CATHCSPTKEKAHELGRGSARVARAAGSGIGARGSDVRNVDLPATLPTASASAAGTGASRVDRYDQRTPARRRSPPFVATPGGNCADAGLARRFAAAGHADAAACNCGAVHALADVAMAAAADGGRRR